MLRNDETISGARMPPTECGQPACDRLSPCSAERSGWCAHPDAEDGFGNRLYVPECFRELEEFCGRRRRRDWWYVAAVVVVMVLAVIGLLALLDAAMGAVVSAGLLD